MNAFSNLPLFPLGLVCFPDERLPLHIFEPRYKEMVGRCMREHAPFGIVLFEEDRLSRVGCLVRVEELVEQHPDGTFDIVVRGEQRFEIQTVRSENAYLTGDGQMLDEGDAVTDLSLRARVIAQHMRLLELAGRAPRPALYEGARDLSYLIAHNAGLGLAQQQELLELSTQNLRLAYLSKHLETFIPRVEEAEELRRKIGSNGHFPDFPPPEE